MNPQRSEMAQLPPFRSALREFAGRLIESEGARQAENVARGYAAAAACNRLYRDLSRWVGRDGCHALFARALAQTRTTHPLLASIQLRPGSENYVEGVAAVIMRYGDAAATSALEAMIVALIELLARLIGDDMATRLIEQTSADLQSPDTKDTSRREEA